LFEDEEWTNFNYKTDDSIKLDKDWDFISVAVNQSNNEQFAFASFSEGGLKIVNDGTKISEVYTSENSVLENSAGRINISDLKYDDDGNLWLINAGIKPLKVLRPDGTWYEYSLGAASNGKIPYRLLIDEIGNKWVGVTNVGLVAFNENGTFDDESDDNLRVLVANEGFGNLPSIFVKGLAQDVDGEIWIGTESGLVVLYSRSELYDGGYGKYDANPILLTVNGEVERLLGETYITAIAVDGGNRKWIGTSSSGVFCFSPDGLEEIYRFNEENSPLISDNILDIKIDQLSGEVYFATEKGLVSFRSDASLGDSDFSTVSVFPNPVRPEYAGPITVQGLGYDSDVKITDVSGNLIYQTFSNGGTVIWNGLTLTGERVQSGVYLVWSGSLEGKGKNVSKIVFIN
jgi:ligand-binding sensor domain-containing protein